MHGGHCRLLKLADQLADQTEQALADPADLV